MSLATSNLVACCRERGYGEIDPSQPADFVGFWANDLVDQGIPANGNIWRWKPHGDYSNQDRQLSEASAGKGFTLSPTGLRHASSRDFENELGFVLTDSTGVGITSPVLTMKVNTQMYLRMQVWSPKAAGPRCIFRTTMPPAPYENLRVDRDSSVYTVSWFEPTWEAGQAIKSLSVDIGGDAEWAWIRIFLDKTAGTVTMQIWDSEMRKMLASGSAPFGGLFPVPEDGSVRHWVGYDGVSSPLSQIHLRDFGYGNSFKMPPEPQP